MSLSECTSRICFGCEPLGGTDWGDYSIEEVERAVDEAVKLGVNFFDTAAVYGLGLSEQRLSSVLAEKRHDLLIATKGGLAWSSEGCCRASVVRDSTPYNLSKNVERSLKNLRLERLPLFYVHWPDKNTNFQSTFEHLNRLKSDGLIDKIGVSNFSLDELVEATQFIEIDVVQIPANILDMTALDAVRQFCSNRAIDIVTYNSLASGLLTGKYQRNSVFPDNDRRSRLPEFTGAKFHQNLETIAGLAKEAAASGLSLPQYSVCKLQDSPGVRSTIIGVKTVDQIREFIFR